MINQSLFNLCYVITNTTWICQPPMFAYICFLRYHSLITLKEQWPQSHKFSIQKEYDLILHASNLLKNHKSHNNIFSVHEFYSAFLDNIWLVNFYHIFHIGKKYLYKHYCYGLQIKQNILMQSHVHHTSSIIRHD